MIDNPKTITEIMQDVEKPVEKSKNLCCNCKYYIPFDWISGDCGNRNCVRHFGMFASRGFVLQDSSCGEFEEKTED